MLGKDLHYEITHLQYYRVSAVPADFDFALSHIWTNIKRVIINEVL